MERKWAPYAWSRRRTAHESGKPYANDGKQRITICIRLGSCEEPRLNMTLAIYTPPCLSLWLQITTPYVVTIWLFSLFNIR